MKVVVKLFAMVREVVGFDEITVALPEGGQTVADLRAKLVTEHQALEPLMMFCQIAVNHEVVPDDQVLNSTDEVAVLPPFSGG